ncbi:linker for activation of T-cells family member 2-like isoform X3 [Hemicordylus capensis]|uniref:linker for activation of T-cells family member 2-like isoform X3 n=1 Tax=Hemicordylus capensis TaxID=884348 RepID=UPI002303F99C|nr:linker for activation of T-cells family member 2-like isoform X3 [Hemicordylus capensis]
MVEQEYIEPLHSDYYNCRNFLRPPREQDSCSYQNVARPLRSSGCVLAEVGIYENSLAVQLQKSPQTSESSEDDEPDYINAEVDPNSFPV